MTMLSLIHPLTLFFYYEQTPAVLDDPGPRKDEETSLPRIPGNSHGLGVELAAAYVHSLVPRGGGCNIWNEVFGMRRIQEMQRIQQGLA